jgi:hypothetical protein
MNSGARQPSNCNSDSVAPLIPVISWHHLIEGAHAAETSHAGVRLTESCGLANEMGRRRRRRQIGGMQLTSRARWAEAKSVTEGMKGTEGLGTVPLIYCASDGGQAMFRGL